MHSKLITLFLLISLFVTSVNCKISFKRNISNPFTFSNQNSMMILGLGLIISIVTVLTLYKKEQSNCRKMQEKTWEKCIQ